MMFMIAFWIFLGIALVLLLINLRLKDKKIDTIITYFVFMQFIFIIIAISTNDPIFEAVGLPKGYEWIGGLTISGFFLWNLYLNPLKKRVGEIEVDVGSIKTNVENIKEDTTLIKQSIFEKNKFKNN